MRRSLGLFDVICIGLNAIVGSGIFLLPDDLYRDMGGLSPLAFLFCAIGLLPIALCYAEAASRVDRTGGPYLYTSEAFGPFVGFVVGWMCFANAVFSFAAVALGAADHLGALLPGAGDPVAVKVTALVLIALFAALNYFGAKPGALAIDAFTIGKFAALILLVLALLPRFDAAQLTASPAPLALSGVASATFVALFAAQGFEVVPVPAGETRAPQRHLPVAIVGSLLAASLVYIAVQTVLVGGFPGLATSSKPVVEAARSVGPLVGVLVGAGAVVSMIGFVSGSALGTPRYLYAAAVDRHLPSALAALHPRFESPHIAVVATALLAAALVLPFDYRSLIGMSNVAVAVQYLGTCLAVLRLPKLTGTGRLRGPWIPVLGALVSLSIFAPASKEELGWAMVSLAVGLGVRELTRRAMPVAS